MKVHFILLVILLILNLIPEKIIDRKKFILPLSFLLILVYWAIRYDYGLDYWSYYDLFYSGAEERARGFGEKGYFFLSSFFDKYYQVIIAHSVFVIATLFHMVRKYIPSDCYWLFFLLLFTIPGFHFGMISALRNALAACIIYWAFDLYYIQKKRWLLFYLFVLLAAMFHTSALFFILFPFVHLLFANSKGMVVFGILIAMNIASLFIVNIFFNYITSVSSLTETYADSYSDVVFESNFNDLIYKSLVLVPAFYMCKLYDQLNNDDAMKKIFVCTFLFISIAFIGLDWGGRFTLYLYLFFIIALSVTHIHFKRIRIIYMAPYFLYVFYGLYRYYARLLNEMGSRYSEGNYWFYHTIFEANSLP